MSDAYQQSDEQVQDLPATDDADVKGGGIIINQSSARPNLAAPPEFSAAPPERWAAPPERTGP